MAVSVNVSEGDVYTCDGGIGELCIKMACELCVCVETCRLRSSI